MAAPNTPRAKTERLMNLTMCLLSTRRALPKARIRRMVEAYGSVESDEAFDRMFERDKDDLRELGIPLVTEEITALFDDEPGYRIHQRDYALPDLALAPDELAVLGLAARTWSHAALAGPAAQALRKLKAVAGDADSQALVGIEPRLTTSEPGFAPLLEAYLDRAPVTFAYRRSATDEARVRHVQPWGMLSRSGRWYVTGQDTDRGEPRVFRLSRIEGQVRRTGKPGSYQPPTDHDPRAMLAADIPRDPAGTARVLVRTGHAHELRRQATGVTEAANGWQLLDLPYADRERLAGDLASLGTSVRVVAPAEVVDATRAVLTAAAAAHPTRGGQSGGGGEPGNGGVS